MGRKGKKFEKLCEEEMTKLPGPLYALVVQYLEETEPFKQVHRLIDAFEWAVKWHTVLAVSELMQSAAIPDKMKAILAPGQNRLHFVGEGRALQEPAHRPHRP